MIIMNIIAIATPLWRVHYICSAILVSHGQAGPSILQYLLILNQIN
jgi:hypothetical protein